MFTNVKADRINIQLACLLQATYLYYYRDKTVMTDAEYDALGQEVLENKNIITRPMKRLIDWKAFKTTKTLYYIKDYPNFIRKQAVIWEALLNE